MSTAVTSPARPDAVDLERRIDGTILVRVHSFEKATGLPLPDAVFTFRRGDPQYDYWERRSREPQGSCDPWEIR